MNSSSTVSALPDAGCVVQQIVPVVVLKTVKEILDACSLLCFSHSRVSPVKREGPAVEECSLAHNPSPC